MSKYLVIFLLLFSISSSAQTLERRISDKWMDYNSKPKNNTSIKLNKGSLKGAKWSIDKITTERGYEWVQLKVIWTAKSWSLGDSKLSVDKDTYGFIAKDTLELERLCKRIEESFGIRTPEGDINSYVYIGKVKSVYKNKLFYINYNYKRGNETGYPLKKGPALELVNFLRQHYHFFEGYDQPAVNCISLQVDASDAFDRGDFDESEAIYAKLKTMNCRENMNNIIAKYGACLTHIGKYQQAIEQYNWINEEYKRCSACHQGYFYFESGLVKMNNLNDYNGALTDVNTAISFKQTSTRLRTRAGIYQKMNHYEKAENDLIHANRLDSIFYMDLIKKKTTEINESKDTTYWRQVHNLYTNHKSRAYYYRNIKMHKESREDSLLAIKYNKQAARKKIKKITSEIDENKYPEQLGDKYWLRAKNYDIIERFVEAKLDYDKALVIKPDYYRYLLSLSRHYMLSGDLDSAMETADSIIELESSESFLALIYEVKGEIYVKQQNKEMACEMYQKLDDLGHWSDTLRFECQ